MESRVDKLLARHRVVEKELESPDLINDRKAYTVVVREHAYLTKVKDASERYRKCKLAKDENESLLKGENDPEMVEMIQDELTSLELEIPKAYEALETLLVPPDPRDHRPVIVELRAGAGGDEAAIFVGDCLRMYKLYADILKWKVELLSSSVSETGGFKECMFSVSGENSFRFMQYESGGHRVQRIPETETQGRVHTSMITIAVLLEPEEDEVVDLDEKDLRIDTYRASGAGGQHVNTTDSAVRITHIPSGAVAYCQEERSQHKNKDKAMRLLVAKIKEEADRKAASERSEMRSSQIGSGDRSERIRTYNFPQNRITDHRIGLTQNNLKDVMQGDLRSVSDALVKYYHDLKLQEGVS